MKSAIERAARAICEANDLDPDQAVMEPGFQRAVSASIRVPGSGPYLWERFVPQARAALNAIREPSDAMIEEGSTKFRGIGLQTREAVDGAWQAMIDAALEEG